MKKSLLVIGLILTSVGFLLWLIFTIINITLIGNHNLNVDFPTITGTLGIITLILSFILPDLICALNKGNKNNDKFDQDTK